MILLALLLCCGKVTTGKTPICGKVDRSSEINFNLAPDTVGSIKKNASVINVEFIDRDSVRINGKLHFITKTNELFQLLGQPDSIVNQDLKKVCTPFFDYQFKYAYFKNSMFEIHGDTTVIMSINFQNQPEIELATGTLTLNHNTSLVELEKSFPNAVANKHEICVNKIGKTISVQLAISQNATDDSWVLFFLNGKLLRIDYYMPC